MTAGSSLVRELINRQRGILATGHRLHRHLSEFDFRYNNRVALGVSDQERATRALEGVKGKLLKYR